MRRTLILVLVVLFLGSCASSEPEDPEKAAKEGSALACNHFRNVAGDVSSGVLTDAELREKLKEIYDNSSIATPDVRDASQRMLASMTQGDSEGLSAAVNDMGDACTSAGH